MSDTHVCIYFPNGDDKRCYVNGCQYNDLLANCTVGGIVPNRTTVREMNPWHHPKAVDIGGKA